MDPELKKALDALNMSVDDAIAAQNKIVNELRDTAEANAKARDAVVDEKLNTLQDELGKFSELNNAMAAAEDRAKADKEELQATLDQIEARLNRPGAGGGDAAAELREKAFVAFARKGASALTGDYQNALQVSDDSAAGVLAHPELVRSILKEVEEYSPLRGLVSIRTTGSRSVQQPKRTGLPEAVWSGETETRPDTEGLTFGMLEIPVHEATMAVPVTNQMLEDDDFNLLDEIREAVVHAFSKQEAAAIVSGNKDGKPEGFLNAAGTVLTKTGTATTITSDAVLRLQFGSAGAPFKGTYASSGRYVLNNTTLGEISLLKSGDGQYLYRVSPSADIASTIGGKPYTVVHEMPEVGAGLRPIAFADWKRAYQLVDRLEMRMLRDDYTRAGNGQVLFRWRRRVGGAVTIAEAINVLSVEA